jgi:hypothetical protein
MNHHHRARRPAFLRAVATSQLAVGAALTARPDAAYRLAAGPVEPGRAAAVVRLLGARMLLQAIAQTARPTPTVLAGGAAVDAAHAASMVALARVDARYRRPARVSAALAGGFAAALAIAATRGRG